MSYTVLARKYRPETFSALVGQDWIARALTSAIKKDRTAHAFLFSGPRGVGKTSMARILSKALNCEKGPTPEPCLKCSHCLSIAAGNDVDVLEIDAASNRGIDHIRALRENVRYAPASSRHKIYIIDEVHMLTTESFNALLKTLEEPPDHVKFIFATTEPQKMPETVRSRCQIYEFRRISGAEIAGRLKMIADEESIRCEPGVLERIALLSRGGLRDAESLLDQIASLSEGLGTFEGLNALTGRLSPGEMGDLVDAILDERPADILDFIERVFTAGTQGDDLLNDVLDYWRALMMAAAGNVESDSFPLPGSETRCREQAGRTDLDRILACMQITLETMQKGRWFDDDRVLAEIALLKMARISHTFSLSDGLRRLGEQGGSPASRSAGRASRPTRPSIPASPENEAPGAAPKEGESPSRLFGRILEEVEKKSRTFGSYLRRLRVESFENDTFLLVDPSEEKASLFSIDNPEYKGKLDEVSMKVLGRPCKFTVRKKQGEGPQAIPPSIRKAMDLFDGDLV